MLRLFDVVFEEKCNFKQKVAYLEACSIAGSFVGEDPSSITDVTKKIKALITLSSSRTEGLALLLAFLPQCSAEIFSRNGFYWVQSTLRIIQERSNSKDKSLACSVLGKIIPIITSFPELSKTVATNSIPTLVQCLLRVTPEHEWKDKGFELLAVILTYFPGPCGKYKFELEKLFVEYLDQWCGSCLDHVTSCIALMPFLGGSGAHGVNHSAAWQEQILNILNSMNSIVEALYTGAEIAEGVVLVISNVELPQPQSSDPLCRVFQLNKIYEVLCISFAQMLSKHTSAPVKVPVEFILTHICRALSINIKEMAAKPSINAVMVASVMPSIHLHCLMALESLICCSGKQLIPQSKIITDLLLQVLNWSLSENIQPGFDHPYGPLRKATYEVISVWAQIVGCGSGLHLCADQLFSHIAYDFKPQVEKHKLQSKDSSLELPRHSKKRKSMSKDFGLDQMMGDTNLKKLNSAANKETVISALNALKTIIYSCGPMIDVKVWKNIQISVIGLLLEVQQQSWKYPIPYANPLCREALYRVLQACLLGYNSSCPPPISVAIAIFSIGRNDENEKVAYSCMEALTVCDSLIHPKISPIQYIAPTTSPRHDQYHYAEESNATEEIMESDYSDGVMAHDDESSQSIEDEKRRRTMPRPPIPLRKDDQPKNSSQQDNKHAHAKKTGQQSEDIVLLSEGNDSDEGTSQVASTPRMNLAKIEALERMGGEKSNKSSSQIDSPAAKQLLTALMSCAANTSLTVTSQNVLPQNAAAPIAMTSNSSSPHIQVAKGRVLHNHPDLEKHRAMQNKEMVDIRYNDDSENMEDDEDDEEEDYDDGEDFYEGRGTEEEEEDIEETFEGNFEEEEDEEDYEEVNEEDDGEDLYSEMIVSSEEIKPEPIIIEKSNIIQSVTMKKVDHYSVEPKFEMDNSTVLVNLGVSSSENEPDITEEKIIEHQMVEEHEEVGFSEPPLMDSITIVSAETIPESEHIGLQEKWHSDENGLMENDLNERDQPSSHLVDLSDCRIAEENISPNEVLHQNSLIESAESPASVVRSEAVSVLEHTLDQIETNDSFLAIPNSELTNQVSNVPIKEKQGLAESYQRITKKIHPEDIKEDDITLPAVHVMQEAFDSRGKDE